MGEFGKSVGFLFSRKDSIILLKEILHYQGCIKPHAKHHKSQSHTLKSCYNIVPLVGSFISPFQSAIMVFRSIIGGFEVQAFRNSLQLELIYNDLPTHLSS